MKKFSFVLTSGLIIALITFFLLPIAVAQSPDIIGEWEFVINIIDNGWDGEKAPGATYGTFYVVPLTVSDENTDPNYRIVVDDEPPLDNFIAFVHDGMFAFYKENLDNCCDYPLFPDPPDCTVNFGREMITGKIIKGGTKMVGKGLGFDSKPNCGGTWSYTFTANKTSAESTFLKPGWDDLNHPLTNGQVIWNQPESGLFQVTYVLEGASPDHEYQVGIHLFLKPENEDNEAWDDFGSEGWEDDVRPEDPFPICRWDPPPSDPFPVEYCGILNAWEFGFLTTDEFGNGSVHFDLHPNLGAYEIQFNVRGGRCGVLGYPDACGVVFESGGVYTTTETIIIKQQPSDNDPN